MQALLAMRNAAKKLEPVTPDAFFEAKELMLSLLEISETVFRRDAIELSAEKQAEYDALIEKRCSGYPLQYLIGSWDFYGLPFLVGPGVLIPRADTETLVETARTFLKGKTAPRVLDLCSGSGCIALTLGRFLPDAKVYALEKEEAAFSYLSKNAKALQSAAVLLKDDALCPVFAEGEFDLILSNPPYLSEDDRKHLQREVSFEPETALFDGGDGLHFYRELTRIWKDRLKAGGMLAFEIGIHQEEDVKAILRSHGFYEVEEFRDLGGVIRVVCGKK